MLGSTSLIETSLESGSSLLGSDSAATRPEDTLATFLLHVVGAAVSKLHQHTYILQSGHCPRLARACAALARQSSTFPPGVLHNVDQLTELLLQLRGSSPTLSVQWLYILILLERCPLHVWACVLNTGRGNSHNNSSMLTAAASASSASSRLAGGETGEPSTVLRLELVRRYQSLYFLAPKKWTIQEVPVFYDSYTGIQARAYFTFTGTGTRIPV